MTSMKLAALAAAAISLAVVWSGPALAFPSHEPDWCYDTVAHPPPYHGNYKWCTPRIESAQETNYHLAVIFFDRGLAYDNLGQPQRAIREYDQAIQLRPDVARAFYYRGIAGRARFGVNNSLLPLPIATKRYS